MRRILIIIVIAITSLPYCVDASDSINPSGFPIAEMNENGGYILCDKLNHQTFHGENYLLSGNNGWLFRNKADFREDFILNKDTYKYIRRYSDVLKKNGTDLYMVVPPTRGMLAHNSIDYSNAIAKEYNYGIAYENYMQFLSDLNKKSGVKVVPLGDLKDSDNIYFKKDLHWSNMGSDKIAKVTADYIRKNSDFKNIPEKTYTLKTLGKEPEMGGFRDHVSKICKIDVPLDYRYKRKMALELSKPDDKEPSIVLFGSNNSNDYTNFKGALKKYIRADIDNRTANKNGVIESPLNYTMSGTYNKYKPSIIIWEFMPYFDFDKHHKLFKQLIPSVYGECKGDDVIYSNEISINKKTTEIFRDLDMKKKKISGHGYYIYIDIPKPLNENLNLYVLYADGLLDEVKIKALGKKSSKYYYEIMDNDIPVMHISMRSKYHKGKDGIAKAKICRAPQ